MQTPPAVGIDLGTTFSLVAYLDADGKPCTIPNSEGDLLTPSVVLFDEADNIIAGKEAVKAATFEPDRVAQFAKRDMGSPFYSKSITGVQFPPEVIQSHVLKKLKMDAEAVLGPFTKVVITVPAYFNEPRRKATQDAGRLAGLEVLNIINEPTAAAIAYGYKQGLLGTALSQEKILVYDLGGGTFDVSIMKIEGQSLTVLATAGDVYLGGVDWDQRIVDFVAERFQAKFPGADPRTDPAGFQRLLREAEDAKRALSVRDSATIAFDFGGKAIRVPITRREFEVRSSDLLERTRFTTRNLLKEAGLGWPDITRLLAVGGSSRMPMVQTMLEVESGKKVDRSLSADEAVAHGAAIYAGLLLEAKSGAEPKVRIQNVNSHSLGVLAIEPATGRPRNGIMIPRNTPLPYTKRAKFKTNKANQASVVVNVIEGGDASGNNSTPIGKCIARDLPSGLPAGTPVEVAFTYADNGRLTVQAGLPDSDTKAIVEIERAAGLSDAMLQEWDDRLKNGKLFAIARPTAARQASTVANKPAASPPPLPTAARPSAVSPPLPTQVAPVARYVEPPPLPPAEEWFYESEGQAIGPFSLAQIRDMAASGMLERTDLVRSAGARQWVRAGSVGGLFS